MSTTYAKSQTTAQKKEASSAASVLDSSSQSESLQRKADMANNATQRAEAPRPNNTGMPDNLKAGIESLSGFSMDDVRVHYNSSKPATVQALAYTQGTDIHVAPGQEKHLPHEAWHVAQQMAGRVSPTTNVNGMPVNDNAALEHEADVMGEKAMQCRKGYSSTVAKKNGCMALQRMSFAAKPLADSTLQWESKGTPWHGIGERKGVLPSLVDQYKKEMLTYIAKKIEECVKNENEKIKTHNAPFVKCRCDFDELKKEFEERKKEFEERKEEFEERKEGYNELGKKLVALEKRIGVQKAVFENLRIKNAPQKKTTAPKVANPKKQKEEKLPEETVLNWDEDSLKNRIENLEKQIKVLSKKINELCNKNIKQNLDCGPHISVVITGGVWYISVNSDAKIEDDIIKRFAEQVFGKLETYWKKFEETKVSPDDEEKVDGEIKTMGEGNVDGEKKVDGEIKTMGEGNVDDEKKSDDEIKTMGEGNVDGEKKSDDEIKSVGEESVDDNVRAEAVYIALRWAVSRGKKIQVDEDSTNAENVSRTENIQIVSNPTTKDKTKRVHAEMQILNGLTTSSPNWKKDEKKEEEMRKKMKDKKISDADVDKIINQWKELNANVDVKRVVRVGGTKIPCFDCFYEMGGETQGDENSYRVVNLGSFFGNCRTIKDNHLKIESVSKLDKYAGILQGGDWKPKSNAKYECLYEDCSYLCDVFSCNGTTAVSSGRTHHGSLYQIVKGDYTTTEPDDSDPEKKKIIHDGVRLEIIGGRYVTTMTSDHGIANNTWFFRGEKSAARSADFHENKGPEKEQGQNYVALANACMLFGINLDEINQPQ